MYLRLEKPVKKIDGSWDTSSELVNMDGVVRVWVELGDIKGERFVLLHLAGHVHEIGRFYFGPGDMRRSEQDARLTELHVALSTSAKVGWSMRTDHEARQLDKTKKLPSITS